jgi:hypothetical protein
MVSVLVSCFLPFLWYLCSCRIFYHSYGICTCVVLFTFLMVSVLVSCMMLALYAFLGVSACLYKITCSSNLHGTDVSDTDIFLYIVKHNDFMLSKVNRWASHGMKHDIQTWITWKKHDLSYGICTRVVFFTILMVSVLVSCFLPFLWYLYSCRAIYLSYGICTCVVLFTVLMVSVLVSCFLWEDKNCYISVEFGIIWFHEVMQCD